MCIAFLPNAMFLWVTLLLSPLILLGAYNAVQIAGLKNEMNFQFLSVTDVCSNTIHFIVTITLAYMGMEYWALVIGLLLKYLTITSILQIGKKVYTGIQINYRQYPWQKHYTFGKYVVMEKAFSGIVAYADVFIIGHFFGMGTLGIYDVLKKIIVRPCVMLYNSIEQIIYPILSRNKSEIAKYNDAYRNYMRIIIFTFMGRTRAWAFVGMRAFRLEMSIISVVS